LNSYNTVKACSEIRTFIDDLSTWYVRNSRDRFNEGDSFARKTLYRVLGELSKLIAPIIPFSSEKVYQDLHGEKASVHLEKWPTNKDKIDEGLISNMQLVRNIVSEGLRIRDKEHIGLKWPLSKVNAKVFGERKELDSLKEIILQELNVKEVEISQGAKEENVLQVELDTKITPELEAEGYLREMTRKVQAFRKELGLSKDDKIELEISCDENLKKILDDKIEILKDKTNSKLVNITTDKETFKNKTDFKIKERRGVIGVKNL
jgi:isoleucyl-tRNA synthetase